MGKTSVLIQTIFIQMCAGVIKNISTMCVTTNGE